MGGLENIAAGDTAEDIMAEMMDLRNAVMDHSERWAHTPPSCVVFCTLPLAPKYCSLYLPPCSRPCDWVLREWIPPLGFRNRYEEVRNVNDQIIQFHRQQGLQIVRLDNQWNYEGG